MAKPDRRRLFNFPAIAGYAVAVASVAVALAGSRWLDVHAVTAPVSMFLCAIMFCAWFGGFGPGLLATTLAILAFKYYYAAPLHSLAADVKEIPRIFVFALSALFAGLLSAAQRSATGSFRRARDDLAGTVQALERSNAALHAENLERIRAEEALRNAQADLARVARLTTMGELAASIAHEVNQPLMAVVTNADTCSRWLAKDPPDLDEARRAAERIVSAGHRAADIIRTIRTLARKSTAEMTRFDINSAISEVLALTGGELRRHDVLIEVELSAGLEPVSGDRGQMQQVILNLTVNAIEAMTSDSHHPRVLRVSSRMAGPDNVLVAVADTGTGLDQTVVDGIFDAFFTTKPDGMGMGLSICRSIVEAHGGRLWASPNSPRGSIFQFTVPAAAGEAPNDSAG
jgi:C4-dicarboxylate-specific signal transduction histidine kinase